MLPCKGGMSIFSYLTLLYKGKGRKSNMSCSALPSTGGMPNIQYFTLLYQGSMSNMLYFTLPCKGGMSTMSYFALPYKGGISFGQNVDVSKKRTFGKTVTQVCQILGNEKAMKIRTCPVYKIVRCAIVLLNVHTCFHGCETGTYFGTSAPDAEDYLNGVVLY